MTRWADQVRQALRDPRVRTGIAQVATFWMEEHIQQNIGRGKGGRTVSHEPLKTMRAISWVTRKPRNGYARTKTVPVKGKNGKVRMKTLYGIETVGYRTGGQPLRDTGNLARSLGADCSGYGASRLGIKLRGEKYGLFQDRGFTTKGPNYIPLTKKGKRGHGTGNNPNNEGLARNKDYLMAWKGVTVPSRPFILPLREDLRTLGQTIVRGLRAVLKGR